MLVGAAVGSLLSVTPQWTADLWLSRAVRPATFQHSAATPSARATTSPARRRRYRGVRLEIQRAVAAEANHSMASQRTSRYCCNKCRIQWAILVAECYCVPTDLHLSGGIKCWSEVYARAIRAQLVKVVGRRAVVPSNRLPLRVAPVPGEAADSWLEVTARFMDLPLRAVVCALELPFATRPTWIRWLSRDQLDVIQAATGVSSSVVEALTLSVYDGTARQLDRNSHRLDASSALA